MTKPEQTTYNNRYQTRCRHSGHKQGIRPANGVFFTPMCFVFTCFALAVIPAHNSYADTDSRYLDAVRTYADNALKLGKDVYGDRHTPMFVDGLNIHNHEPPKWKRDGKVWVLSNLASHQNLFRTLDALTTVTGDQKYRRAAEKAIEYAFENLTSPNGLLYWGGHMAYDAQADDLCMEQYQHELKCNYPYYELMWQVNPKATEKFLNAFWAAHILDWSNLEMNRHGSTKKALDYPWNNVYKGGPVFFWGTGLSFINTGSDLFYAGAMLSKLSGRKEPLIWAKRLAHRYVETRNPKTGIGGYQFSQSKTAYCNGPAIRGDRAKYQYGDDFKGHFVVEGTLFPCYGDTPVVRPRICQFLLGEMLGPDGKEFTQWALEELTAWGKAAYRKKDNSFIPMLTDGTSMEGYVCKKDGYFGPKGRVLKAGRAGPIDFWTYAMAYRVTGNEFMWEMARNIELGDGYGDIGQTEKENPKLNINTDSSSPELLLAFLELYKKTAKQPYLKMAQRIGDNILTYQFHKGFFVQSKEHLFCKFDTVASLVLLHLDAALRKKSTPLPRVWPGRSYFHCPHDGVGRTYDNNVIYNRKIGSKPPADFNVKNKSDAVDSTAGSAKTGPRGIWKRLKDMPEPREQHGFEALNGSLYVVCGQSAPRTHKRDVYAYNINNNTWTTRAPAPIALQSPVLRAVNGRLYLIGGYDSTIPLKYDTTFEYDPAADTWTRKANMPTAREDMASAVVDDKIYIFAGITNPGLEITPVVEVYDPVKDTWQTKTKMPNPRCLGDFGCAYKGAIFLVSGTDNLDGYGAILHPGTGVDRYDPADNTWNRRADIPTARCYKEVEELNGRLYVISGATESINHHTPRMEIYDIAADTWTVGPDAPYAARAAGLAKHNGKIYLSGGYSFGRYLKSLHSFDPGANPVNDKLTESLHQAAHDGDIQQVKLLLSGGADVNERDKDGLGGTPLHKAGEQGHRVVAELLIANGADVNARDKDGITPLHYAAGQGHMTVAELLIAKGANVSAKSADDLTPLHFAALGGSRVVARMLLAKGADVNAKDKWRITALHYAAKQGHRDMAEFFISERADANAKSYAGSTPLHFAALGGHRDMAELLIARRADVNAKNNEGRTPLSLAKNKGHNKIAELLRKHGAKE
jgi:pectate lyase